MAFTTENRNVSDIFQRSAKYKVPRYQRDYVWNRVNWKELWNDLTFTIKSIGQGIPWSHFLGTIVLNKSERKQKNLEIYEVIDGQQRLTTIYVLLIVLFKNFNRINSDSARQRAKYIYETYLTSLNNEAERELVIDNENYNMNLKEFIDFGTNSEAIISSDNSLLLLFRYFDNLLIDKEFEYLEIVLDKLTSVNIVEIISGEDEEIYNIFEVLNARGQKLRQIDLLKNHIMKYVQPREDSFIDQARRKWSQIMDNVSNLTDPDILIQHFAKCYIEKKAENQHSVYRLIKDEIEIDNLGKFLNDLLEFSEIYNKLVTDSNDNSVLKYFKIKNNSQIRSLICAIYTLQNRNIISADIVEEVLKQIRNFFFIFNVTRQTSNKTDKLISNISYQVYSCQYEVEFKFIFSDFLYKCNDYIKNRNYKDEFINNTSFRYSNVERSLRQNNHLVKYVLENVCNYYQHDTIISANEMTIEHLISDNGMVPTVSLENLTLATEDLNSNRLRNKSIKEKIEILSNESSITVNKKLGQYFKNNQFDFTSRRDDLVEVIFDQIFNFSPEILHLKSEDINIYRQIEKILIANNELDILILLKKHGRYLYKQISANNQYETIKERFFSLYRTIDTTSWQGYMN